jgi:hypothetical protein
MYSVQQLLFDSMSYIKEFQPNGTSWHVAVIGPELAGLALDYDIWLHRPALSRRAAETVAVRLRNRFCVQPLPNAPAPGRFLFLGMYQTAASRSEETGSEGRRVGT